MVLRISLHGWIDVISSAIEFTGLLWGCQTRSSQGCLGESENLTLKLKGYSGMHREFLEEETA